MSLETYRHKIDKIDEQLVEGLNQRASLARQIGWEKQSQGLPLLNTAREDKVLAQIRAKNPGPLTNRALSGIYREIISACREVQSRERTPRKDSVS